MYSNLRSLIFKIDPERAHFLAIQSLKLNLVSNIFDENKNDPILKGASTTSNNDETKVYKTVFSTCNIENKKCRGWELQSEEFNHDKKKRIFEYFTK